MAMTLDDVLKQISELRENKWPCHQVSDATLFAWHEALSAHLTQPAQAGWRPIATAPQDGTRVLLWVDQMCRSGSWRYFPADAQNPCAPTHWQPLPASPTPDKEG